MSHIIGSENRSLPRLTEVQIIILDLCLCMDDSFALAVGVSAASHEAFLFFAFKMMALVGVSPHLRRFDAAFLFTTHMII